MAVLSVSVTPDAEEASRTAFQSEAAAHSYRKNPHVLRKFALGSAGEKLLPAAQSWPQTCTVTIGHGKFTGSPYSFARHVSAPIALPTEFKLPEGWLLGRVKRLFSSRGARTRASQHSTDSTSESEIENSVAVVVQGSMTANLGSKESFHSFETVQEYYPSCLDVLSKIEKAASGESDIGKPITKVLEPSSNAVAKQVSTSFGEGICRAMTIQQLDGACKDEGFQVPDAHADSTSTNSRAVDQLNYELNAPIIPVRRKESQKVRDVHIELSLSTAIRKKGRVNRSRGKVRVDRTRRMKPRALGRITPASGSEDSGKNGAFGCAKTATSRLGVIGKTRFGRDAGMNPRLTWLRYT